MDPTLLEIPFDHFQRYDTAARIVEALQLGNGSVLEVGANRQRLLGRFLPGAELLYTDIESTGADQDFVVADATDMPFQDGSFDVVVSLDVLEHIPVEGRAKAIAEMARVSRHAVVVGCPTDEPWVHAAEADANGIWSELFGGDYEWLAEHKEFGLVDAAAVVGTFEGAGMRVERIGHADPTLWSGLMGLHFAKVKFPEMEPLVAAADRLYNGRVCRGDAGARSYREYFIAMRPGRDTDLLRGIQAPKALPDDEAVAVLERLASSGRQVALRTQRAEVGWTETVKAVGEYSNDLAEAKAQWEAAARMVRHVEADLAEATAQWGASARMVQDVQADLAEAKAQWQASAQIALKAEADLEFAKSEWGGTAKRLEAQTIATEDARAKLQAAERKIVERGAREAQLNAEMEVLREDLEVAKREWGATAALLRARESELDGSRKEEARLRGVADRLEKQSARKIARVGWAGWLATAVAFVLGVLASRSLL